ncbi:MAG: hypothetical protein QNK03_04200 [Myxococcota bacterium]|nr:hypothetical protein [Myxococcota bacterium]
MKFAIEHPLAALALAIVVVIPTWKVCLRMGYPGWFSLAIVIPGVNLLFLYFLGWSEWPIEKGLEEKPALAPHG